MISLLPHQNSGWNGGFTIAAPRSTPVGIAAHDPSMFCTISMPLRGAGVSENAAQPAAGWLAWPRREMGQGPVCLSAGDI
jgi:hypothetical protein